MNQSPHYPIQTMFGGWTRIDMLLALYDRAIISVRGAQSAQQAGDEAEFAAKFIDVKNVSSPFTVD